MELNSGVSRMKVFFNLNSQGNEKYELFSRGTYVFQNLGNDYENVKEYAFDWFATNLWLRESTILWNVCTFQGMNFDECQESFVRKSFSSFSHKNY